MHRYQQIAALLVERTLEAVEERLQRSQKKCKWRAQLMADVREKPAFDLIHFAQLIIALFQHLLVAIELKAQIEFPKTQSIVKIIPRHHDGRGAKSEIEVIYEIFQDE